MHEIGEKTMRTKIIFTLIVVIGAIVAYNILAPVTDVIQAQAGVQQLSNDPVTFLTARELAKRDIVGAVIATVALLLLAITWLPSLLRRRNGGVASKLTSLLLVLVIAGSALSSCKPYKGTTVVEIAPNQTAFMLPAVGDTTAQQKFDSVEFLQSNQVAAKIVEITYREHKTGRPYWAIDFVPNQILILVDRTPVSRQWTYSKETGTGATNQAIALESRESIGFYHGVVVNAVILEEDAATFLYYYGGAGQLGNPAETGVHLTVGLEQVMDSFVRTWVADRLYSEFKALTLEQCQEQAGNIFTSLEETAQPYFKEYGITILSLGGIEGLVYDSDEVQAAIDAKFNVAAQATAQAITNQKQIEMGFAQATQTVVAAQAGAEALRKQGEELAKYPSLINYILAQQSTGAVPQVLVTGADPYTMPFPFWFYYGMGTPTPSAPTPTATLTPTPATNP